MEGVDIVSDQPIFPPEIDKWIEGCKVRSFPWIDKKRIYFNVQYFAPGQSLCKPPVWDRTVFIVNNEAGRRVIQNFTHSLVTHISTMTNSVFMGGKEVQFEFQ